MNKGYRELLQKVQANEKRLSEDSAFKEEVIAELEHLFEKSKVGWFCSLFEILGE